MLGISIKRASNIALTQRANTTVNATDAKPCNTASRLILLFPKGSTTSERLSNNSSQSPVMYSTTPNQTNDANTFSKTNKVFPTAPSRTNARRKT